jgi:EAL domain-containing protein (putative c-di-GMP-specific phosphodiesterase class I)
VLRRTELQPRHLTLEITESVLIADDRVAAAVLAGLKDLGVALAIDDFGAGYSSLAYLKRLPVDALKIDRSFVQGLGRRPDTVIVAVVISLGEALGLEVVVEGIETADQLAHLRRLGCAVGQGYHFAPPLPAPALAAYLDRQVAPARRLVG